MINSISFLNAENELLKSTYKYQKLIKKSFLKYIDEISTNALTTIGSEKGDIAYKYLTEVQGALKKIDGNLEKIKALIKEIEKILKEQLDDEKEKMVIDYNRISVIAKQEIYNNNIEIQTIINKVIQYIKFDFSSINDGDNNSANINISSRTNVINNIKNTDFKENVLVISDIKQKVVLPYKISDLNSYLEQDGTKYMSLQDVIEKEYTITLDYYKNSAISRFREAYNLIKNKSNGSIRQALDLGLELFFKYDLNPAIITACQNVDELDIYLACLEDNDLSNFKCFEIIYESLPVIK